MASFVSMNLNSDSDSDDTDFVPETNKYSDDSGSDTEAKVTNKRKKEKSSIRAGGIFLEDDTCEKKFSENRSAEFEQEILERKELETEKKVDDLWADFKKDTSVANVKKNNDKARSLGALCSMKPPKKKIKNKTVPIKKPNKAHINTYKTRQTAFFGLLIEYKPISIVFLMFLDVHDDN